METYLFICYANRNRSPTAAGVCRKLVNKRKLEIKVKSAGIDADDDRNPLSDFLLEEADVVFVMERGMLKIVPKNNAKHKKPTVWTFLTFIVKTTQN